MYVYSLWDFSFIFNVERSSCLCSWMVWTVSVFSESLLARNILHPQGTTGRSKDHSLLWPPREHAWARGCSSHTQTPVTPGWAGPMGPQSALRLWSQGQNRHICMGSVFGRNEKFQMKICFFNYFRKKESLQEFCAVSFWCYITLSTLSAERQCTSNQLTQRMIDRGVQTLTIATKENKLSSCKWLER